MPKLDALLAYQETELQKGADGESAALHATPARSFRVCINCSRRIRRRSPGSSEELETRGALVRRLTERTAQLEKQLSLENGELETMLQDEESTAEEMTELRGDIEKLNREMSAAIREAKTLLEELEKAAEEYQQTRRTASKAKKEYDQVPCRVRKGEGGQRAGAGRV